jgi:CDP-diacylglycerol--serine O-phosphatidyltransferase
MIPQRLRIRERFIDPQSRRPRRAAYALPTLFTAGNLFLGYIAIVKSFQAAMAAAAGDLGHSANLDIACICIGAAVFLDGLDGRIARMTNTVSDFGRELDSLADVITFGVAPGVLAWVFGFQFLGQGIDPELRIQIHNAGYFLVFLYMMCGASRLARFNIAVDPVPRNPGKPGRKYFVGLPIPAAAAVVAAIVYASGSAPLQAWPISIAWLALLFILAALMVSTWRYRSFKDFNLFTPRSPKSVLLHGCFIFAIWNYSRPVLLFMALTYVGSGIVIRIGGIIKRRFGSSAEVQNA